MLGIHTVNLIRQLKPKIWFIENPASSMLKHKLWMRNFPFADCSYCMYSDWGYQKTTRLWSNLWDMTTWRPKLCKTNCLSMILGRHRCTARKGWCRGYPQDVCFTQLDLYRVPPDLIQALLDESKRQITLEQLREDQRLASAAQEVAHPVASFST
jgi:hypothetical protein